MAIRRLAISVVGAGAVGTTLAILLHKRGHRIVSVVSGTRSSARSLASRVHCANFSSSLSKVSARSDIMILAVPDERIDEIARKLSRFRFLPFRSMVVVHTSGTLSSDVLKPLEKKGATTFSLHPIQSFPKDFELLRQLRFMEGTTYGFEGPTRAYRPAKTLTRQLGGKVLVVPKEAKILYHVACVFASNYVVAVLGAVEALLARSLRTPDLRNFEKLITASVENCFRTSPADSLTGPVARGSVDIVKNHIRELSKKKKDLLPLYKMLGLYALDVAVRSGALSRRKASKIKQTLTKSSES